MFLMPGLIFACYITKTPLGKEREEAMQIYLKNHQQEDGGWGLHVESPSSMFGTAMSYVSLRLLGLPAVRPSLPPSFPHSPRCFSSNVLYFPISPFLALTLFPPSLPPSLPPSDRPRLRCCSRFHPEARRCDHMAPSWWEVWLAC